MGTWALRLAGSFRPNVIIKTTPKTNRGAEKAIRIFMLRSCSLSLPLLIRAILDRLLKLFTISPEQSKPKLLRQVTGQYVPIYSGDPRRSRTARIHADLVVLFITLAMASAVWAASAPR